MKVVYVYQVTKLLQGSLELYQNSQSPLYLEQIAEYLMLLLIQFKMSNSRCWVKMKGMS